MVVKATLKFSVFAENEKLVQKFSSGIRNYETPSK